MKNRVHTCLDVLVVTNVLYIPRSVWYRKKREKPVHPICIIDAYHNYILDKRMRWDHIDFRFR